MTGDHETESGDETIATLRRGDSAEVRIRVREWQGRRYVDLRLFDGGAPTKKGLTLRIGEIVDVCSALDRALTRIAELGSR